MLNRRIAATAIITIGIAMIALVVATDLFARSRASERLTADTRDTFTTAGVQTLSDDVAALETIGTSLGTALPALGAGANLTPAQIQAFIARFPQVERGLQQIPAIAASLRGLSTTVAQQAASYRAADAIPTTGTTSVAVPWFIMLTGIASVLAGVLMFGVQLRWAAIAAVLGIVVLATPIVTGLPGKSSAADELNAALRPLFTQQQADTLVAASTTLGAFATQLTDQTLPAIADLLDSSVADVQAGLTQFFPELSAALARAPDALARLADTAADVRTNLGEFELAQGTSYEPIAWLVVAFGITILVATAGGTSMTRAGRAQLQEHMPRRVRKAA